MSSSYSEVSPEIIRAIQALHASGQLDMILQHPEPSGAMHDGSKRRAMSPSPSSIGTHDFEVLTPKSDVKSMRGQGYQVPVVPSKKVALPEGITSVHEWGRTMCDLPKIAHRKMSYRQIVKAMDEGDVEMQSYIKKLSVFRECKSPKVDDLMAYLKAVNVDPSRTSELKFPGTDATRVLAPEDD